MRSRHTCYTSITPPPPLSHIVASCWAYQGYAPAHAKDRVLPSGTIEIIIPLRRQPLVVHEGDRGSRQLRGAVVTGIQSRFFDIDTAQQRDLLGVHVRAGCASGLLGIPADAIEEDHVELSALWGPAADALVDSLASAASLADAFTLLLEALTLQVRTTGGAARHPAVEGALTRLAEGGCETPVVELAAELGLSHRRFVELFRRDVGTTPKRFARLRRFQAVVRAAQEGPLTRGLPWSSIAQQTGHFDQSHLVHELRAFAGMTPGRLASLRPTHREVPLEERGQILPIPDDVRVPG
ncbi:helix-turn-helix domain-containing protein [Chondromyces crocatus]|uniref:HTH araC/xylS-type domain-containing protein n=1 Tax=Chondromyces crocatus TaxID=52 RepID=A0A0K1EMS8_CHOCO|nr:helix-turn-helix domain-containing protein [Chondromyces crocatus]AKT42126.1 uncharacterized protein CMC5_063490 [Chondromyces crocatus]